MAVPLTETGQVELEGAYVVRDKDMGYLWTWDTQDIQIRDGFGHGASR